MSMGRFHFYYSPVPLLLLPIRHRASPPPQRTWAIASDPSRRTREETLLSPRGRDAPGPCQPHGENILWWILDGPSFRYVSFRDEDEDVAERRTSRWPRATWKKASQEENRRLDGRKWKAEDLGDGRGRRTDQSEVHRGPSSAREEHLDANAHVGSHRVCTKEKRHVLGGK